MSMNSDHDVRISFWPGSGTVKRVSTMVMSRIEE
jgi:hypothetical protein